MSKQPEGSHVQARFKNANRDCCGQLRMPIDLRFVDSTFENFRRFGEDGRLGICWASKGRPRPLGFAEKPEDKRTLLVLERIKQE